MSLKIMTGGFNKKTLVKSRKDTKNNTISVTCSHLNFLWEHSEHTVIRCLKTQQTIPLGRLTEMGGCSRKPFFLMSSLQAAASQRHFVSQIICERSMNVGHQKGKIMLLSTWSSRDPRQAASCPLGYSWPSPGTMQKIKIRPSSRGFSEGTFQHSLSSQAGNGAGGAGAAFIPATFPKGEWRRQPAGLWFGRAWRDTSPWAAVGDAHAAVGLLHRHPAPCCAPNYGAATSARH